MTTPAADPTPVRDAATVVLLRDGDDGVEAWLLTRTREMAFAAGMSVFPGGRVDDHDADVPLHLSGQDQLDDLATRSESTVHVAHALLAAAARETYEETGVLLTHPPRTDHGSRADVEAGRLQFGELLRRLDTAVDVAALRAWSRWVTPPGESRRYDTRFFVAALPAGAEPADVTSESSAAGWVPAAEALAQAERGERGLMPPTAVTLSTVLAHGSVAEVLAAATDRDLSPVRPELIGTAEGTVARLPDGRTVPLPRRPA